MQWIYNDSAMSTVDAGWRGFHLNSGNSQMGPGLKWIEQPEALLIWGDHLLLVERFFGIKLASDD
jgi:hypothetical protein